MATDRELILKRIAYQIEEADKLVRNDPHCCMIASEYAKGEILGLTSLREFIEATLPTAEEVDYWAVYIPGYDPSLFCIEGAARACAAGLSGKVHRVVIRRLEDKA